VLEGGGRGDSPAQVGEEGGGEMSYGSSLLFSCCVLIQSIMHVTPEPLAPSWHAVGFPLSNDCTVAKTQECSHVQVCFRQRLSLFAAAERVQQEQQQQQQQVASGAVGGLQGLMKLDMSGLYTAVHVAKSLGQLDVFRWAEGRIECYTV